MSAIEWTDVTWNPQVGCDVISPGCKNCYAMPFAWRLAHNPKMADRYQGTARLVKGRPVWTGQLNFDEATLRKPLTWRKPRRVFVNSMSDLFHDDCPDEWIDKVFAMIARCPQHQFQILTKRSGRMRKYMSTVQLGFDRPCWPLPNVWLGVSVEDQRRADERIPDLLATPAAIRFLSCEPLLGPIDLRVFLWDATGEFRTHHGQRQIQLVTRKPTLDLVIAGGESGPRARPLDPDVPRLLRDQCQRARVAFFFKQWGETLPAGQDGGEIDGEQIINASNQPMRIGKKAAGRLLDGRTWDDMPGVTI